MPSEKDRKGHTNQRQVYTDTVLLRIYLEGVLFPYAKSVSVNESESGVTAQIEVPPSIKVRPDEWAGMTCHIFYANKRVLGQSRFADPGDNNVPTGPGWPILFQGELSGETVSTSVQSENIVLNFVSQARHFEQTLMHFWDPSRQENVLDLKRQSTFVGSAKINMESSGVLSKRTQVLVSMTRRIAELEADGDRNIAFSAAALEILRSAGEQHAIFGYFNTKFKLTQRFAAYMDPDVKNILDLEKTKHVVENRAQALPSFASIMQLLEIPTGLMKYNWNQLAQPQLRPGRLPTTARRGDSADELSAKLTKAAKQLGVNAYNGRTSISTNIGTVTVPADLISSLTLGKSSGASFVGIVPLHTFVNDVFVEYEGFLEADPDGDSNHLLLLAFQSQVDSYKIPDFGQIVDKKKKEEVVTDIASGDEAAQTVIDLSDNQNQDTQKTLDIDQAALVERDELNEFAITPNLQFAHPPKCNVFFPASFGMYGITRNHFQEPTRLYGKFNLTPSARDGENVAVEVYIAPLSQAYHFLDGTNLARFSPAYEKFLEGIPHAIPRPDATTTDVSTQTSSDFADGGVRANAELEEIASYYNITIQEAKELKASGQLDAQAASISGDI